MDGINTLRYSDLFLAMYFDGGKSCLHRNHSHVLVYVYSGEMVIDEKGQITRLHKGECAFIRKDFSVQMTKQAWNGEQFKAIFLMFTMKFPVSYTHLDLGSRLYGQRFLRISFIQCRRRDYRSVIRRAVQRE